VPTSRTYTYTRYIQRYGDSRGTLVVGSDHPDIQMVFRAGESYGIAMVEPLNWRYAKDGGGSKFSNFLSS
jgi:hypothetical protein